MTFASRTSHLAIPPLQSDIETLGLSFKKSLDWLMRFAAGLTRFELEGPVATFIDFSWQNQTLDHELVNVSVPFSLPQTQPIALNRLATFSAHIVENGHILSRKVELAPVRPTSGSRLSGPSFNFRRARIRFAFITVTRLEEIHPWKSRG